ncbi:MAG: hypothetical protein U0931_29875 [Vulcanimicrobiota bacterium]
MKPIQGPSYESLLAENARLKARLREQEAPGFQVNLQEERVCLRGLNSPDLQLNEIEVKVPGLAKVLPEFMKLTPTRGPWGDVPRPDPSDFAKFPMQVERLQVGVTEEAINRVVQKKPVEGLSELKVKVEPGGRLKLSGVAHKIFDIPFEVQGRLLAQGDTQLRFRLEATTLGGFLPLPNLMTNFFASFASDQMAKMQVRQQGDDYVIETKAMVPENVQVKFDRVRSQGATLFIESGPTSS